MVDEIGDPMADAYFHADYSLSGNCIPDLHFIVRTVHFNGPGNYIKQTDFK